VSVGSYLIVEDGVMDLFRPGDGIGTFAPGPLWAIERFVRENTDFVVDQARERYLMTYNPKGFLKRVR
jgi:cephalosporin hydroxylase